jgi:hypothetical protein
VTRFAWSCLALALCAGTARADVIFQNNTDFFQGGSINYVPFRDDGTPNRPAGSFLGETVTFAGTARQLDSVMLGVYNESGSTFTYTLDLYAGANPNTGALLGSVSVAVGQVFTGMPTFNFGGLLVPDTITFVVHSSDTGTGFPLTGPISSNIVPTVGSGPDSLWYGNSPGNFVANNTWAIADGANRNYLVAQFNASSPVAAIPEPASLALAGLGLVTLVGYRLRRRSAA